MSNKITAVALRMNSVDYLGGKIVLIDSAQATVDGTYWRVGYYNKSGFIDSIEFLNASSGVKPTSDAVKTLKIVDHISQFSYYIAIADNAGVPVWTNLVNTAAGSPASMPGVTIPVLIIEAPGIVDVNNDFTYQTFADVLGANQVYVLLVTGNGTPLGAPATDGYASIAAAVAYANAGIGNGGLNVFTNPSTTLVKWVADVTTGYVNGSISLTKSNYADSAVAPAPGANGFFLSVTMNGVAYTNQVKAASVAALATAANADAQLSQLGIFTATAGNTKIRLVTTRGTVTSVAITAAP